MARTISLGGGVDESPHDLLIGAADEALLACVGIRVSGEVNVSGGGGGRGGGDEARLGEGAVGGEVFFGGDEGDIGGGRSIARAADANQGQPMYCQIKDVR